MGRPETTNDQGPTSRGRVRVERGEKRIRALFDGEFVADSTEPRLVWEVPYHPTYYLPTDDVRTDLLVPTGETDRSPSRGDAEIYDIKGPSRTAQGAARLFPNSPLAELRDLVRLDWNLIDSWFEEDEEVYVHPRDPKTRVDILHSSRHVEVRINDELIADSTRPTLLFETGLPTRFYLPKPDVRLDLLTPTTTETLCPYKGTAEYWSVTAGGETIPDLAWSYRTPVAESQKIAGLIAFLDEKVDVTVDGTARSRPSTTFS